MVRREVWRQSDGRRNIRHSTAMPVHIRRNSDPAPFSSRLRDIGQGGLGLSIQEPIQPGETCEILFPLLNYPETVKGRVVWCKPESDGYAAGVQFLEEHPYTHARLVVDVCHVEYYRRDQRHRLGRDIDHAVAVQEWNARNADQPRT